MSRRNRVKTPPIDEEMLRTWKRDLDRVIELGVEQMILERRATKKLSKSELEHKKAMAAINLERRDAFRTLIKTHYDVAVQTLRLSDDFLKNMIRDRVLTKDMKDQINSRQSPRLKAMELMLMLYRIGTYEAKASFINALRQSRQDLLADIFEQQEMVPRY